MCKVETGACETNQNCTKIIRAGGLIHCIALNKKTGINSLWPSALILFYQIWFADLGWKLSYSASVWQSLAGHQPDSKHPPLSYPPSLLISSFAFRLLTQSCMCQQENMQNRSNSGKIFMIQIFQSFHGFLRFPLWDCESGKDNSFFACRRPPLKDVLIVLPLPRQMISVVSYVRKSLLQKNTNAEQLRSDASWNQEIVTGGVRDVRGW